MRFQISITCTYRKFPRSQRNQLQKLGSNKYQKDGEQREKAQKKKTEKKRDTEIRQREKNTSGKISWVR